MVPRQDLPPAFDQRIAEAFAREQTAPASVYIERWSTSAMRAKAPCGNALSAARKGFNRGQSKRGLTIGTGVL